MAMQRCIETGCNTLTKGTRCPTHARGRARAKEAKRRKKRPNRQSAYNSRRYRRIVAEFKRATDLICHICGEPIPLGEATADHVPPLIEVGDQWHLCDIRPSHPRCNFGAHNRKQQKPGPLGGGS